MESHRQHAYEEYYESDRIDVGEFANRLKLKYIINLHTTKMTDATVIQIVRDAFYYVLIIAGPLLLLSLVVGLVISIFQAATSINEQTLTFVPKLVLVFIVTVLALPYMLSNMKTFTITLFTMIPALK